MLENGQASRFAAYFDVDWHPPEERLHDVVLLPVLGDHYGRVLERFEIRLVRDGGSFHLQYHDHMFPVAPRSLDDLLAAAAERGARATSWPSWPTAARPPADLDRHRSPQRAASPSRQGSAAATCWTGSARSSRRSAEADRSGGRRASTPTPRRSTRCLDRQNYRLAFWRTAGARDGLSPVLRHQHAGQPAHGGRAGLRGHALADPALDRARAASMGCESTTPTACCDPEEYFRRLRPRAPDAWIVVEKILEPGERLPANWLIPAPRATTFSIGWAAVRSIRRGEAR